MTATFRQLRGADCPSGPTCEGVHDTGRGTLAVTGRLIERVALGQAVVEVTAGLAPELTMHPAVTAAAVGRLHVTGEEITDPDERAQLRIGTGETSVEIAPISALVTAP